MNVIFKSRNNPSQTAEKHALRDIQIEALCDLQQKLVKTMPLGPELNEKMRLIQIAFDEIL